MALARYESLGGGKGGAAVSGIGAIGKRPGKPADYDKGKTQVGNSMSGAYAGADKNMNGGTRPTGETYKPSGSSGSSSSSYTPPQIDYRQQIIDQYKRQNEDAKNSALKALEQRLNTSIGYYDNQLNDLGDQYQTLRNQSEVERYKAKGSIREALANRGQLDSGLGRQETLYLDTKFGNAINNINQQEQKARDEIQNMIAQLKAEYEAEKAQTINQYNSLLQSALASL